MTNLQVGPQAAEGRHKSHRDALGKPLEVINRFLMQSDGLPPRSTARSLCSALLAVGAVIALSGCAHVLPDDPFDGDGQALSMVPINHTDRYATNIYVEKYWAGNVDEHAGGGAAVCCFPGLKDWSQPVTVRWTWGTEEDPETKAVTMVREPHTVVAHFPHGGPHDDPDPYRADAYLCVILRDLNTAELAFSPSASGCANK